MKKRLIMASLVLGLSIVLASCGSSGSESSSDYSMATADNAYDDSDIAAYDSYETAEVEEAGQSTDVDESATTTNRKLIKNVELNVETTEYDSLVKNLEDTIKELGGYIESLRADNGNTYYSSYGRSASITARIPAAKLDGFINQVGETANIIQRNESVRDVTLTYVDMDSHKKMLVEEQNRLMELLESATSIEDIITIESRLSEVRYQIESMESQLRTFDNQVDYSTVVIYIEEVVELTPIEEESAGTRIRTGFMTSLRNVGHGIKEFFINLIIALPYLFVWAIVIIIIILIIRVIMKIADKRSAKLMVEMKKRREENAKRQPLKQQSNVTQGNTPYVQRPGANSATQTDIQAKETANENEKEIKE